jgi:hypothetical protein
MLTLASGASATDMHCAAGYCHWGYNNVGPSVNALVTGTWNYWQYEHLVKNSGGTIRIGWNSAATDQCWEFKSGNVEWTGTPANTYTGCGGYVRPYVAYSSGNTSYLFFEAYCCA